MHEPLQHADKLSRQTDRELDRLADQHHQLENRLHELSSKPHLSDPEHLEEVTLKKRKLQVKDRMETILRERQSTHHH